MTELQIGLLGLGGIAILGVVVYNTWLEYRHRKLAQQLLKPAQSDALLEETEPLVHGFPEPVQFAGETEPVYPQEDIPTQTPPPLSDASPQVIAEPVLSESRVQSVWNERIEPVLHLDEDHASALESGAVPEMAPVDTLEPESPQIALSPVSAPMQEEPLHTSVVEEYNEVAEPSHLLSPTIDFIAAFEAVELASSAQILESQANVLSHLHKPLNWFGFNELTREWETMVNDGRSEYRSLRIALQLVDRRGPVTENDLTVFHMAMHDLAHDLMAIVDLPQRQAVLETAAALDEFCASVDIQIGINVMSAGNVFPGTKVRALAEAAGMLIDAEGRFVRTDDEGNVLYVLSNQESAGFSADAMKSMATHGLTFLLDVPTVAHGDRVFNQMIELAKRFADVLKGVLVDDNRRPLPDGALEPIRRQIGQFQSAMAERKLPAGGVLAKRLFS